MRLYRYLQVFQAPAKTVLEATPSVRKRMRRISASILSFAAVRARASSKSKLGWAPPPLSASAFGRSILIEFPVAPGRVMSDALGRANRRSDGMETTTKKLGEWVVV